MTDISEIGDRLNSRAEEVARYLLPGGKRVGHEWRVGSLDGEAGQSLGVHLSGNRRGVWSDFSGGQSGGDLLDLWAAVRGIDLSTALREAKDYLGIAAPTFIGSKPKEYRKPAKPQCTRPVSGSPVMDYLTGERLISPATIAAYQIAEHQNGNGPEIIFPYKRGKELLNLKYLALRRDESGKKITRVEQGCELCLFGWQAISPDAREVLICEGEMDALTYHHCGVPALSVPNGAESLKWIENEYEYLERFETIFLSWDMDKTGQSGVAQVIDRLGRHRCRVVKLPYKDANECLQHGFDVETIRDYVTSAASCDPAELKRASEFVEDVIKEFYPVDGKLPGFPPPWPNVSEVMRFCPGEITVWSGFNFTGKTTVLNQVILAGMDYGERACIASLEVPPRKLLKRMTRQALAEKHPAVQRIRDTHAWYDGRLWMFNLVGTAKGERLFSVFEYARRKYGVTQFVIDSLVRCGLAEDDYNGQKKLIDMSAEFATSHEVHVHIVVHARKASDDTREFTRMDVKGAGAITDLAHNVLGMWRNRKKEKEIESAEFANHPPAPETLNEPDAILFCDKMREGDWAGRVGLWFHSRSYQFLEGRLLSPRIYIPDVIEDMEEM